MLLLALPNLAAEGYRANARGCRQWSEGLGVIRKLRHEDHLPKLVVVALGSNGTVNRSDIHKGARPARQEAHARLVTSARDRWGLGP